MFRTPTQPRVTQELLTNSQGIDPVWQKRKSSLFLRGILTAAGTAGATLQMPVAGDRFFYDVGTGPLLIRPDTQHENQYFPGMGLQYNEQQEAFSNLQIANPNSHAVYFIIFAGFDNLDDRRTFYPSLQFKQIVNSVFDYTVDAFDASIAVPDLSGTVLTYNGVQYYAVNRQLLYAASTSNDYGLYIKNAAGTRILWPVPKNQGAQIPLTGDLTIEHGGADAQPIISELYNCLQVPT
jgi:hypothetical protein